MPPAPPTPTCAPPCTALPEPSLSPVLHSQTLVTFVLCPSRTSWRCPRSPKNPTREMRMPLCKWRLSTQDTVALCSRARGKSPRSVCCPRSSGAQPPWLPWRRGAASGRTWPADARSPSLQQDLILPALRGFSRSTGHSPHFSNHVPGSKRPFPAVLIFEVFLVNDDDVFYLFLQKPKIELAKSLTGATRPGPMPPRSPRDRTQTFEWKPAVAGANEEWRPASGTRLPASPE